MRHGMIDSSNEEFFHSKNHPDPPDPPNGLLLCACVQECIPRGGIFRRYSGRHHSYCFSTLHNRTHIPDLFTSAQWLQNRIDAYTIIVCNGDSMSVLIKATP